MRVLRRFARQVAEQFRPDKIVLFGSYAYGTPHEDSDVDILGHLRGPGPHVRSCWALDLILGKQWVQAICLGRRLGGGALRLCPEGVPQPFAAGIQRLQRPPPARTLPPPSASPPLEPA